jgi:hypothetical protein
MHIYVIMQSTKNQNDRKMLRNAPQPQGEREDVTGMESSGTHR